MQMIDKIGAARTCGEKFAQKAFFKCRLRRKAMRAILEPHKRVAFRHDPFSDLGRRLPTRSDLSQMSGGHLIKFKIDDRDALA
jgi:hypothetical protein